MSNKLNVAEKNDQDETVIILSGQQLSSFIDCAGMSLVGVRLPASFTGSAITFQESLTEGGTYRDVYDTDGNLLLAQVAANRTVIFGASDFAAIRYLKIKSNATEGSDRTINVILRAV